jgi:hypothetical protein
MKPSPEKKEKKENDKFKECGKYDYTKDFVKDMFLDAKDTVNTWCLAQIIDVFPDNYLLLHYDGWSKKYDEVFQIISSFPFHIYLNIFA